MLRGGGMRRADGRRHRQRPTICRRLAVGRRRPRVGRLGAGYRGLLHAGRHLGGSPAHGGRRHSPQPGRHGRTRGTAPPPGPGSRSSRPPSPPCSGRPASPLKPSAPSSSRRLWPRPPWAHPQSVARHQVSGADRVATARASRTRRAGHPSQPASVWPTRFARSPESAPPCAFRGAAPVAGMWPCCGQTPPETERLCPISADFRRRCVRRQKGLRPLSLWAGALLAVGAPGRT